MSLNNREQDSCVEKMSRDNGGNKSDEDRRSCKSSFFSEAMQAMKVFKSSA